MADNYIELARSHLSWITFSVIILAASAVVGYEYGSEVSSDLLVTLLSNLITSIAAVLAISFSVLFISTQIASERHSPEFVSLFANDPIVRLNFGLGIFCIVANGLIMVLSPTIYHQLDIGSSPLRESLYWGSGGILIGLSIVFFTSLYPFIRLMLIQTTPDNILSQFNRRYDSKQYINGSIKANNISQHPLQPVYELARNSIQRGDYSAADSAINSIFTTGIQVLNDLPTINQPEIDAFYDPILNRYGTSLIHQSEETGFNDGLDTTYNGLFELGQKATEVGNHTLFKNIFSAVSGLYRSDNEYEKSHISKLINCFCKLFYSTSKDDDLFSDYVPNMSRMVESIKGSSNFREYYSICTGEIVKAHKRILNEGTNMPVQEEEALLGKISKPPNWKSSEKSFPPHLSCTYLIMQTTSRTLQSLTNDNPPAFLFDSWEDVIGRTPPEKDVHLEHLFRRYIEFLIYMDNKYGLRVSPSNRIDGIIENESQREVAIQACDTIMSESRSVQAMGEYKFLENDITEIWSPVPMAEYSSGFLDSLDSIKSNIEQS